MSDVVFRRIHGRIVPLRKKPSGGPGKGIAAIVGGVAAAIATGAKDASLTRKAAALEDSSRTLSRAARAATNARAFTRTAEKALAAGTAAVQVVRGAKKFSVIGNATAAALMAYGAKSLSKHLGLSENQATVAGVAAGAATVLSTATKFKVLGGGSISGALRSAITAVILSKAK